MKGSKKIVYFFLIVCILGLLSGCSGKKSDENGAVLAESAKDTLTIRIQNDPGSLDYHFTPVYLADFMRSWVTNRLLSQERDGNGNLIDVINEESLAESYKYDDDNMGITFSLRKGILFHNGKEMTSADVVFSCKLFSDISQFFWMDADNARAIDDYTVHIPFKEKNANVLYLLDTMLPIYCESYYNELGGESNKAQFYGEKLIGTGPYKVAEWIEDDYIRFERNDSYFAGAPKIKTVIARVIYENSVALMELETEGIDVITDPGWIEVDTVLKGTYGDKIDVLRIPGITAAQLGFNLKRAFADKRIREAICYAINRETVAKGAYEGIAELLNSIVSKSYEGVKDYTGKFPFEYNPEKAKQLLAEAGYPNGLNIIMIFGGDTYCQTAAEIIGKDLKAVGINMEIQGMDGATVVNKMATETNSWDLWIRNWGMPGNAFPFFIENIPVNTHCTDDENYNDYIEKVRAFMAVLDYDERQKLWGEFQDNYLKDYLYTFPLVQINDYTLVNSKLKGLEKVSPQTYRLKDAYFEK
jgi:peptide/nickel transport system substrate-binding protein